MFKTIEHRAKDLRRRFRKVSIVEAVTEIWV